MSRRKHRHPEGYVPPKPVLVFAGTLKEARAYALENHLEKDGWLWPRDPDSVRYLPAAAVAILPGFEDHPMHDLLAPLAEALEDEHGPHVPHAARPLPVTPYI